MDNPTVPTPPVVKPAPPDRSVPGFQPMVQHVPGQPPTMKTPQPIERVVAHTGVWLVRLGGHEQRVVNANSRAGAWDAYRKLFGIVTSDWPPEIGEVSPEDLKGVKCLPAPRM